MSSLEQLMHACASALHRSPWEVQKYLVYLHEEQLLTFAKDVTSVSLETLVAWGVPARLALEMKDRSGIFAKRPMLLCAMHQWLSVRGKRNSDMDAWSVSSEDVRFASFRLEPPSHTRAKDFISCHIQPFLGKFRLRRRIRKDAKCEVALWLRSSIAGVVGRSAEASCEWRQFLVHQHWIRSIQDVKCVPASLWEQWSIQGHVPFKVSLLLRKLEPSWSATHTNLPVLPATVKRGSSTMQKSTSAAETSDTATTATSSSGMLTSSLKTLQEKLLEFTAKRKEEDPEWLAKSCRATAKVNKESVEMYFGRRQSRWHLEMKENRGGEVVHSVNLLTVSKVARLKEESVILIKHREAGENKELVIECDEGEISKDLSKKIRKVINWAREQSSLLN